MFLKNRNIISKIKISKVTDYAALRALTRILKTGVPESSLPKSGSPTIQKNIHVASFKKAEVPAQKMGVQDCKLAVSESHASYTKLSPYKHNCVERI